MVYLLELKRAEVAFQAENRKATAIHGDYGN
jgi:hypothetical protein